MGISENKAVVMRFTELTGQGDVEGVSALLADDCRIWFQGLGLVDKAEMLATWVGVKKLKASADVQILSVTAEEDRVAMEWTGNTLRKDGTRYGNVYHMLYRVQDGRIVEIREYCDTFYLDAVFPGRVRKRELALRPTSDERYEGIAEVVAARQAQLAELAATEHA